MQLWREMGFDGQGRQGDTGTRKGGAYTHTCATTQCLSTSCAEPFLLCTMHLAMVSVLTFTARHNPNTVRLCCNFTRLPLPLPPPSPLLLLRSTQRVKDLSLRVRSDFGIELDRETLRNTFGLGPSVAGSLTIGNVWDPHQVSASTVGLPRQGAAAGNSPFDNDRNSVRGCFTWTGPETCFDRQEQV